MSKTTKTQDRVMDCLVLVEWEDSKGVHASWTAFEAMKSAPAKAKSVGWVLEETDAHIHLVPHIAPEIEEGIGDIIIPKAAIFRKVALTEVANA